MPAHDNFYCKKLWFYYWVQWQLPYRIMKNKFYISSIFSWKERYSCWILWLSSNNHQNNSSQFTSTSNVARNKSRGNYQIILLKILHVNNGMRAVQAFWILRWEDQESITKELKIWNKSELSLKEGRSDKQMIICRLRFDKWGNVKKLRNFILQLQELNLALFAHKYHIFSDLENCWRKTFGMKFENMQAVEWNEKVQKLMSQLIVIIITLW